MKTRPDPPPKPKSRLQSIRLPLVLLSAILVALGAASCSHYGENGEESRVRETFESCKKAIVDGHADQVMSYIPSNVDDYFAMLKSGAAPSVPASAASQAPTVSPGVDLLLRKALERKVAADLRPRLTLGTLMLRIADRRLLNPRDVQAIDLGRVTINGNRASAEIYYQDMLTALRLPFVKQGDDWKIDVLAILPYAEVLLRVDRAIKGETETQQVDQLVNKLPSL